VADLELRDAVPTELDMMTAYRILRLRVDVFVVEQECPYPELDGRDLEPGTRWVWAESQEAESVEAEFGKAESAKARSGTEVTGTLRILREPGGTVRIGRVVTSKAARSSGVGALLMNRALELVGPGVPLALDAQAHLEGWYARFGFARCGDTFLEDGIPHVPMRTGPARTELGTVPELQLNGNQ